ncbi:sperm acrosome-associated protein 5-like [Scleropages formosus]|nr:lysozyme C-like [Scleropages formosus]KPP56383.1 sperm acrosome-associated protein 5-like [Scleropages formosus]
MKLLMLQLLLLGAFLSLCNGRQMSRCEVVKIFKSQGLDGFEGFAVGNYVCMAYWESRWKTHRVRESNNMGKDYGIFQINSAKWCDDGSSGGQNQCGVLCTDLLKDDLKASVECLKIIVKKEGLKSWDTWDSFCNGRKMKRWVKGCD